MTYALITNLPPCQRENIGVVFENESDNEDYSVRSTDFGHAALVVKH